MHSASSVMMMSLRISTRRSLPRPTFTQSRRDRHGVLPNAKPRWVPPAKSKMYKNPPRDMTPPSEVEQMNVLKVKYNEHFSALSQYLYEDHLKYSDVGEAGRIEAEKEEKEMKQNIKENEEDNKRVAEARVNRLAREMEALEVEAKQKWKEHQEKEEKRLAEAREVVREQTEKLKHHITDEKLEEAIAEALDHPVDHEFAIDTEGHIYPGRYTRSNLVPQSERKKMPLPENPRDFLRAEKQDSKQ